MPLPAVLPALLPTGSGGSSPPPLPPEPPAPVSLTITAAAVNVDCERRPAGILPGIEITVASQPPGNIVGPVDASFEDGTTGTAVPMGCMIENSTTEALDGTHSLELVSTVAGAAAGAMSVRLGPYPIIPGRPYTVTMNVRGGVARTVEVEGLYFDGDTEMGSGGSTTATDSNTAWLGSPPFLVLSDAPAGATSLIIELTVEAPAGPIFAPTGLSVTPSTTGSTLWAYVVTAVNAYGESLPGSVVQITNGPAALGGGVHNTVSWLAVSGATDYHVYRGSPPTYGDLVDLFDTYAELWATIPTYADLLTFVGAFEYVGQTASTSFTDNVASPTATLPPTQNTTGEPAWFDEIGAYASTDVTVWSLAPAGTVTIVRSDGQYVLGASPLYPLTLDEDGTATVTDWNAPYGLDATYVPQLFQLGKSEAPGIPSPAVQMGQAPDTCAIYGRLGWAKEEDETRLLEQWLSGIGQMLWRVHGISTDSYDTEGNVAPSWSTVLDINRCPTAALPWLGQFVGARVPSTLRDDQQRYMIEHSPGRQRGTVGAILAAANQYLLPGFSASITERDPDPYSLTITVPDAGVIGNATYRSLYLSTPTYADLYADYATYADLWTGVNDIESAIDAAIPAGLVADVVFA